jgi:methyltransferase family protein
VTDFSDAEERWRQALATWAIPEPILAQAPEDPWALPVGIFEVQDISVRTGSHRRALEALTAGDDVLDIGAGRCAMSLPLRPPARRIVAVDGSPAMLDRSPADVTVLGRWPDVAPEVEQATVVVCGHVLYNVPDLGPFIKALNAAARRRVVVEITQSHPRNRAVERALWQHFWGLERPTGPTWKEAVAVVRQLDLDPQIELWQSDERSGSADLQDLVSWMRRTVCLDASRDDEVRSIILRRAVQRDGRWRLSGEPRSLATIWWDVP